MAFCFKMFIDILAFINRIIIMKQKVKLAKKLSKTFHKGQTYGLYDYFEYHITGVVNVF